MLKLFKKILIFSVPFLIVLATVIIWDPFKVFFSPKEYYKNNYIYGNREDMCMKLFLKNNPDEKFNSFIIGNSRSLSFRIEDWGKFLKNEKGFKGFHFDASGMGIYRINNVIKFLDKHVDTVKNLLLIMDTRSLFEVKNDIDLIYIEPPAISGESHFTYYATFIRASLSPKFIVANIDLKLTKNYRHYMQHFLKNPKLFSNESDNTNGDFYFGYEREIKKDSLGYYNDKIKKGVFKHQASDRFTATANDTIPAISIKRLHEIADICKKNKTNIKIVIAPIYDHTIQGTRTLDALNEAFGPQNVYDYSKDTSITSKISNYYEASHIRPNVAHQIMNDIYLKGIK